MKKESDNMERLTDRFSNGEAFIPNFVSQLYGKSKVAEKLAHYEDLEEQGRLLCLPCKVGDNVWFIGSKCDKCEEDYCYECPYNRNGNKRNEKVLYEITVEQFRVRNNTLFLVDTDVIWASDEISININQLGETVFLTKSEAEEKLKELKGE